MKYALWILLRNQAYTHTQNAVYYGNTVHQASSGPTAHTMQTRQSSKTTVLVLVWLLLEITFPYSSTSCMMVTTLVVLVVVVLQTNETYDAYY